MQAGGGATYQTVTVLFTDLVGSTELANRIGPSPADVLRREHFALLRAAAEQTGGHEVKNLGDGLMLAFSSVTAALDGAVAAQRAIAARNRDALQRFEVRMGIAHGEVTAEDDDYFGEPVVQAARLCALAEGSQILVTDLTKVMAAATTTHSLRLVGPLPLKGLPEPVTTYEVAWSTSGDVSRPLPRRLRGAPEAPHVGRAAEQQLVERAWRSAEARHASLVLLSGEPGIGKTRLASHLATRIHDLGGTVLYGAVDEALGVPYQPWIEALTHYVDNAPSGVLRAYVHHHGADLARLVPNLGRRISDLPAPSSSDGETERYHLIEAVTQLLRAAAEDNPVLVVLDDVHWADAPTLSLLVHLHRNLADSRVLLMATYRDSEVVLGDRLSDALVALRREDRVERLSMAGLRREEVEELLVQVSGQAPTPDSVDLARMLERDTNGNPLFVAEILRDLLERGQLVLDEHGMWALMTAAEDLHPPASVRDVIAQRVERLGPDAHRLLATAALIGRDFELDLLASALEVPEEQLLDAVESAMAASLLTETGARSGSFRFIHGLIAQALTDELSSARRAHLHRRIALSIEVLHGPDLGERAAAVAHHLISAGDDTAKAVDYARRAGQHALGALAPDEALRWFQAALDLLDQLGDDPDLRCDLLADLGEATRDAGLPGYRDHLLAAAGLAGERRDADRAARAVLALARSFAASIGTADDELVAAIEVALSLCPAPDERRARLLGMLAAELVFVDPLPRRRELVDEALDIARTLDDVTLARVLVSSLSAMWATSVLDERRTLLGELRELSARVPDAQVHAFAAFHGIWIALEAGDRADLDRSLADARGACGPASQPTVRWVLAILESIITALDGDLGLAEAQATAAIDQATRAGLADSVTIFGAQVIGLRLLDGRVGEMVDSVEDIMATNPALGEGIGAVLALAYAEAGRLDEAAAQLTRVLAIDPAAWTETNVWAPAVTCAGITAARVGDRAAAKALAPLAARVPHAFACSGATAHIHFSTVLGMLAATVGDPAAAEEHFRRAAADIVAFRAPILLALNRYEHGRALLELGDPADRERAGHLLRDAAEAYRSHGCETSASRCEQLHAPLP